MRTIKFRGKDVETGKWVIGNLFQRLGHFAAIITPHPHEGKIRYFETAVENSTVGQYTGFRDARGKDIYEGDILVFAKDVCNDTLVIVWDNGAFVAEYTDRNVAGTRVRSNFFTANPKMFRVAGNIHDNPELLKGDTK